MTVIYMHRLRVAVFATLSVLVASVLCVLARSVTRTDSINALDKHFVNHKWDLTCHTRPPKLLELYLRRETGLGTIIVQGRKRPVIVARHQVRARHKHRIWTDSDITSVLRKVPGIQTSSNTVIVTASNNWTRAEPLLQSAADLGYRVVKQDIDARFGGNNGGHLTWEKKMVPWLEGVKKCDPLDIVVLSDAFDVIVQQPPAHLRALLSKYDKSVVLGLERNMWPSRDNDERNAMTRLYFETGVGGIRYTCSGVIVGRAWALCSWLTQLQKRDWACPSVGTDRITRTDDQRCSHRFYLEHGDCVHLDKRIQFVWHMALWKEERDLMSTKAGLWKPGPGRFAPAFLHGNGGASAAPLYWNHVLVDFKQQKSSRDGGAFETTLAPWQPKRKIRNHPK